MYQNFILDITEEDDESEQLGDNIKETIARLHFSKIELSTKIEWMLNQIATDDCNTIVFQFMVLLSILLFSLPPLVSFNNIGRVSSLMILEATFDYQPIPVF